MKRVLIAWDWEATGIWWYCSAQERGDDADALFSDLLSHELIVELKRWNDSADGLYGPRILPVDRDKVAQASFWLRGRELAERVQMELGSAWEVVYQNSEGSQNWGIPRK